jgi:hypothetical protein
MSRADADVKMRRIRYSNTRDAPDSSDVLVAYHVSGTAGLQANARRSTALMQS